MAINMIFVDFFFVVNDEPQAVICMFNSAMCIATMKNFEINDDFLSDIETFIKMNSPMTIEMNFDIAKLLEDKLLDNYNAECRIDFIFCEHDFPTSLLVNEQPKLDNVYSVLRECFDDLKGTYDMWITDTSHRIRHGLSKVFLVGNHTTATLQYIINGKALIGQVGTIIEYRGKGYARQLLYYIGNELSRDKIEVHIFARNHRTSFYKEIGFTPVLTDIVFERKKDNE